MNHKLEDWIGYWIKNIEKAINNVYDKKLQQYDLTVSQALVLCQLWNKDGLTQKEIQQNLNLKPASVSGLVDILFKKGFIDRKQDDKDARFKRLYLTDEGHRLENLSLQVLKEIESIISQGFSEEEKIILISWMKKLYTNLNTLK